MKKEEKKEEEDENNNEKRRKERRWKEQQQREKSNEKSNFVWIFLAARWHFYLTLTVTQLQCLWMRVCKRVNALDVRVVRHAHAVHASVHCLNAVYLQRVFACLYALLQQLPHMATSNKTRALESYGMFWSNAPVFLVNFCVFEHLWISILDAASCYDEHNVICQMISACAPRLRVQVSLINLSAFALRIIYCTYSISQQ